MGIGENGSGDAFVGVGPGVRMQGEEKLVLSDVVVEKENHLFGKTFVSNGRFKKRELVNG